MFARVTTVQGTPERIGEMPGFVRERVIPALQSHAGFQGLHVLVDRTKTKVVGIAFFESEEALRASADTAQQIRAGVTGMGATATAEEFEVVLQT